MNTDLELTSIRTDILAVLSDWRSDDRYWLTVGEVAELVNLTPKLVLHQLVTLADAGFVERRVITGTVVVRRSREYTQVRAADRERVIAEVAAELGEPVEIVRELADAQEAMVEEARIEVQAERRRYEPCIAEDNG